MKRKSLFKSLLVAVGLGLGSSAWAYDLPTGYEIKNVFIGTDNGNGTVTAEDFTSATAVPSGWTYDVNSISIGNITEVPKLDVGTATSDKPTYVSGNCIKAYLRQGSGDGNQWRYATYTFNEVSSGKLVFNADFFADGNVTRSQMYLQFLDSDDNLILTLAPYAYGNAQGNFGYAIGTDELASIGTSNSLWRDYVGYGIQDLVFDFATGETSFTLDFTERASGTWHRAQKQFSINIGNGKNISKFRIGKKTLSSTDINFYIDNIKLYTVGAQAGSHSYTIKATADNGNIELATIAAGDCKGGITYGATGLSKVIEKEGTFYVLDDSNVSNYSVSYTMGESDEIRTINYTADPTIVYFKEGETLAQNNASETCSGGAYCGYYAGPTTVNITVNGLYKLETNVTGRQDRAPLNVYPETGTTILAQIAQNGGNGERESGLFAAAANSIVRVGGPYYNDKFQNSLSFDYILIRKVVELSSMSIVGDFSQNGWDPGSGIAMTQDATDPAIWTAVIEEFEANAANYEYKATANNTWGVLDCGKIVNNNVENQNYDFTTAGAGTYRLTFTANTVTKTVELEAVKQIVSTYIVAGTESFFGSDWNGTDDNNKMAKNANGTYSITYSDKTLAKGTTIEYKVVKDGTTWIPDGTNNNMKIEIKDDGTYDITISIDPTYNTVSHAMDIQKTITAAGYATYNSSYDLNFDGSGVIAYIAKVDTEKKVTFEEVTSAPANTGLLLKANYGTYKLKMEVSTQDVTGNALIGVNDATQIPAGSFVLMTTDTKGTGFYKTTKEFTVGAHTAYLPAFTSAREFIGFYGEDTTTGIDNVKLNLNANKVYNLNGQRVYNAQKGLYIVNGKKVVIK